MNKKQKLEPVDTDLHRIIGPETNPIDLANGLEPDEFVTLVEQLGSPTQYTDSSILKSIGDHGNDRKGDDIKDEEFNSLIEMVCNSPDPTEAISQIQSLVEERCKSFALEHTDRNETSSPSDSASEESAQAALRSLFNSLFKSALRLLARAEIFDELVVDHITSHFRFCIDIFATYLETDMQEIFDMVCTLFTAGLRSDLLKDNGEQNMHSPVVTRFLVTSTYCSSNAGHLTTMSEEYATEDKRLTLTYLSLVEYFCSKKCIEKMVAHMVLVAENRPGPPPARVQTFFQTIVSIIDLLRPSVVKTYVSLITEGLHLYLERMENAELKRFERVIFLDLFEQFRYILSRTLTPASKAKEMIDKMRLNVALKQMKCPFMQQRLAGLKEIRAFVEEVERREALNPYLRGASTALSSADSKQTRKRPLQNVSSSIETKRTRADREGSDKTQDNAEMMSPDGLRDGSVEIAETSSDSPPSDMAEDGEIEQLDSLSLPPSSPTSRPLDDVSADLQGQEAEEDSGDETDNESTTAVQGQNLPDFVDPDGEDVAMTDDEGVEPPPHPTQLPGSQLGKRVNSNVDVPNSADLASYHITNTKNDKGAFTRLPTTISQTDPHSWISAAFLCEWFKETRFVEMLFSPESLHTELLKRASEIFKFMATEGLLRDKELSMIWDIASGAGVHESIRDTVFNITADLARHLHKPGVDFLWEKIQAIPPEEHDAKTLLLVRTFTVNALTAATLRGGTDLEQVSSSNSLSKTDVESLHTGSYGLRLFWILVQDDSPCSPLAQKLSLQYLTDLCAWKPCLPAREKFLLNCLENLEASSSVPQSLMLFRRIITSYPISPSYVAGVQIGDEKKQDTKLHDAKSLLELANVAVRNGSISRRIVSDWQAQLISSCLEDLKRYKLSAISTLNQNSSQKQYALCRNTLPIQESSSSTEIAESHSSSKYQKGDSKTEPAQTEDQSLLPQAEEEIDEDWEYDDDEEEFLEEDEEDMIELYSTGTPGVSSSAKSPSQSSFGKKEKKANSNPLDSTKFVGKYTHLRGLKVRLKFLRFVIIQASADAQLSADQVSLLLEYIGKLAFSQEERSLVLSWLMQIHYVANGFSSQTARKALLRWFREFPMQSIHPKAYSFFNYFFLVVNSDGGLIEFIQHRKPKPGIFNPNSSAIPASSFRKHTQHSQSWIGDQVSVTSAPEFQVKDTLLHGFGMLWSLALRASNGPVSRRASQLIGQLYLAVGSDVDPEKRLNETSMDKELFDMVAGSWQNHSGLYIGGFIREAIAQLKVALQEYNENGNPRVVVRCLALLKQLQSARGPDSSAVVNHGHMVKTVNRVANILNTSDLLCLRIKPLDAEDFPLEVYKDSLLLTFRQKVADRMCADPEHLRFISSGKEIKISSTVDSRVVCENVLMDGQCVHVVNGTSKSSPEKQIGKHDVPPPQTLAHCERKENLSSNSNPPKKEVSSKSPASFLSNVDNLELLTGLIFAKDPNMLLATHGWSLLRVVPTNPGILLSLKNLSSSWAELLSPDSVHKLLYTLEIMHYITWCSKESTVCNLNVDDTVRISQSEGVEWSNKVIQSGGVEQLIRTLSLIVRQPFTSQTVGLANQCILLLICILSQLFQVENSQATLENILVNHGEVLGGTLLECIRLISTHLTDNDERNMGGVTSTEPVGIDRDIVEHGMALRAQLARFVFQSEALCNSLDACFSFPSSTDKGFEFFVQWIRDTVLVCPRASVRECVTSALQSADVEHQGLLCSLVEVLPWCHESNVVWQSQEYFNLFEELVKTDLFSDTMKAVGEGVARDDFPKRVLLLVLEHLAKHGCHEKQLSSVGGASFDQTLNGLLKVCTAVLVLDAEDSNLSSLPECSQMVPFLFDTCLFSVSDPSKPDTANTPLCRSAQSRSSALSLLLALTKQSARNLHTLLKLLQGHHRHTALPPRILDGLLDHQKLPPSSEYLYSNNRNRNRLRDRERLWYYSPSSQSKADCGYVGLRNLGCICYMNSLLQQLFMIPELRLALFSVTESKKRGRDSLHEDDSASSDGEMDVDESKEEENSDTKSVDKDDETTQKCENRKTLLRQVQHMFCYLQESEKRFYDMTEFCAKSVVLNYNRPVDIFEQQDVDEFFNVFMDHLESALESTSHPHILRDLFGGVLCNQIICKEGCKHRSEREEKFMVCQLEVKGKASIQESLDLYVEGEMLEGDNKYLCGECDEKRDAQKRACFAKLPKVLILHLKRFEFDLELLRKIKVNDLCEFPMELNMSKYTREGLDADEGGTSAKSEEFEYELVGILVHTGTADSGHYYSYIKERFPMNGRSNCDWFCFNDEQVSPFDTSSIPQTSFGGVDYSMRWDHAQEKQVQQWAAKPFSAYLLIYERKSLRKDLEKWPGVLREAVPHSLRTTCWEENIDFLKDEHVHSVQYTNFLLSSVTAAVRFCRTQTKSREESFGEDIFCAGLQTASCFAFNTAAHSKDKSFFQDALKLVENLYRMNTKVGRQVLLGLFTANGGTLIKQLLLRCPVQSVRDDTSALLKALLTDDLDEQRPDYIVTDPSLSEVYLSECEYDLNSLISSDHGFISCKGKSGRLLPGSDLGLTISTQETLAIGRSLWEFCLDVPCVPRSKSLVTRTVGLMLGFVTEAESHWKHYASFFKILSDFADMGEMERRLMIRLGAIPRLLDFFLSSDSPAIKTKSEFRDYPLDCRNGMSDKFCSLQLGPAVHLLSMLVKQCRVRNSFIGPAVVVPLDEKGGLEEKTVSTNVDEVSWLDIHLILQTNFFSKIVESDASGKDLAGICGHVCYGSITISKVVITNLIQLLPELNHISVTTVFVSLERILEIKDNLHEQRVDFAMKDLFRVMHDECLTDGGLLSECFKQLTSIVKNDSLGEVALWLISKGMSFWSDYFFVESSHARRNASILCKVVLDLLLCKQESLRQSVSSEQGLEERKTELIELITKKRRLLMQSIVDIFTVQNIWLNRICRQEHYSEVAANMNKLLRNGAALLGSSPSWIESEKDQHGNVMYEESATLKSLVESKLEPYPYELVAVCRLCRLILQNKSDPAAPMVTSVHICGLVGGIITVNKFKLECDWNKGELVSLLHFVLQRNPELVKTLIEHPVLDDVLNILMFEQRSTGHMEYNEAYAPPLYEIYSLCLLHSDDIVGMAIKFGSLQHLKWAVHNYVLNEYEKSSKPLYFLLRAVSICSLEFREDVTKFLIKGLDGMSQAVFGIPQSRMNIVRHLLEIDHRIKVHADIYRFEEVENLRAMVNENVQDLDTIRFNSRLNFLTTGGLKYVSSIIRSTANRIISACIQGLSVDNRNYVKLEQHSLKPSFSVLREILNWLLELALNERQVASDSGTAAESSSTVSEKGKREEEDHKPGDRNAGVPYLCSLRPRTRYAEVAGLWPEQEDVLSDMVLFMLCCIIFGDEDTMEADGDCIERMLRLLRIREQKLVRQSVWMKNLQQLLALHGNRCAVFVKRLELLKGEVGKAVRSQGESDKAFLRRILYENGGTLPTKYITVLCQVLKATYSCLFPDETDRGASALLKLYLYLGVECMHDPSLHEVIAGSLLDLVNIHREVKLGLPKLSISVQYLSFLKNPVIGSILRRSGSKTESLISLLEECFKAAEEGSSGTK